MADQLDAVDFALAAYRDDDGDWVVRELAHEVLDALDDLDGLVTALDRIAGDDGALAMIAVDEDFFLVVRVTDDETQVLLSDVTAAEEWDLAAMALDFLDEDDPEDDDDPAPVGDLDLLADLGVPEAELTSLVEELLDDEDLFPDEVLSDVARRLGFGELFDDAVGLTPA
ncbi:MAG: hypothetical protein CMH83_10685 [Nocardioides sp.]|nr:hypothetical protein [Nocardioides sp.]